MSDLEPIDTETAMNPAHSRKGVSSRFEVIKTLGAGGMGEVHLAEDRSLRRKVAIKSIRTQLCQDPDVLKRIERECLLHAKIGTHPHIVTLYDRLEEEGHIQLVMEYVEGETLYSLLDRLSKENKRLSIAQGIAIAVQTLEALARIHTHGIIHRDIKPANIMISHDDCGEYCAKLMDFGIARANDDGMTALTQTGMGGPGTPLYMAPEQIDPKIFGEISPATDVYAMGIMLYQVISGQPPFTGSITEIFNGHLNARPIRLDAKADPHVPGAIADIIETALAKRQENRFSSAAAFREALLSVNTDLASATATSHRPREFRTPEPATGAPATLAANDAALMSGVAAGQTMVHGGGNRAATGKGSSKVAVLAALFVGVVGIAGAGGYWMLSSDGDAAATATAEDAAATPPTEGVAADTSSGEPSPAQGGVSAASVSVGVTTQSPLANTMPTDVQDYAPASNDVAPAQPPAMPPATPAVDSSAMPPSSLPPATTSSSGSGSQSSATDIFTKMRQEKLAEQPDGTAEPEPEPATPVTTVTPDPPAPTPAVAEPKPDPPKTTKATAAPPKTATTLVEDRPAPKADPPPPVKTDEPEKPAGGGFKVKGKSVEHTTQ